MAQLAVQVRLFYAAKDVMARFEEEYRMQYNFKWSPVKARENLKNHRVSFEQATAVFKDPLAITVYDGDESSYNEDR